MNVYEKLKEKLQKREKVTMGNVMLISSPFMLDALTRFDCVLLDKEHGVFDTEGLIPMTEHCRRIGLPAIVRVEDSQYHLIAKAIDMGADGIMLPRTETVEQIKTAVEAMHFPPIGRTGFGGFGIMRDKETFDEFQKGRLLFPQIESPKGLANLPAMIEAYGEWIDGFIIGPNDYSISMGIPRQIDSPAMLAEIQKVFDVCRRYGKSCGCFSPTPDHAKTCLSMGANVLWLSDDVSYLRIGIDKLLADLEG